MKSLKPSPLLLTFLLMPGIIMAQTVNGRFGSSVYTWEKFDTVDVSKKILRGFQTVQLEVIQGGLSLQTYLIGSTDFNSPLGNEGNVRVYNAFLRWKNIGNAVDLNVGRVPVFAGVGNGAVDGGLVKARFLNNDLTVIGYGGANVRSDLFSTDYSELSDNMLIGGQIVGNVIPDFRVGVSYVKRNFKKENYIAVRPDSFFNPVNVPVSFDSRAEQVLGFDARCYGSANYTLYGRYDYDLYLKRTLRGQFSGRISATDDLAVTADYIYREPRLWYNSVFTIFPMTPVREYEGGVEYSFVPSIRTFGKFAYVQYSGDAARRFSLGFYSDYGSVSYSGTNGYAGMLNSVYAQVMYPMLDRTLIPTLGLSFASYRLFTDGSTNQSIFAASLGAVARPQPSYSIDVQLQWLRNPIASGDVRLFASLNYWFHNNLNLLQ